MSISNPGSRSDKGIIRWQEIRWLFLLVFVIGYLTTFPRFENYSTGYFVLAVISFLACWLFLSRLNRPTQEILPMLVIFVVFILAYYVKLYWIIVSPEVEKLSYRSYALVFSSTSSLMESYIIATYAFVAFCLTAWFLLGRYPEHSREKIKEPSTLPANSIAYQKISSVLIVITPVLMVATGIVMYQTGVATMGVESPVLPYRLAGLIFFSRSLIIPALLLLLILSSERAGLSRRTGMSFILLLLYGIESSILRSSRGELIGSLLLVLFLFLVSEFRIQRRLRSFLIVGLVLAMFLFPIITEYRFHRMDNPGNIPLALSGAIDSASQNFLNVWEVFKNGLWSILWRFSGVELIAYYIDKNIQPLGWNAWPILNSPRGLAGYVTVDVFGFSPFDANTEAVGLVGWFYLIGGKFWVIPGIAIFTLLVHFIWKKVARMRLIILPVAQSILLLQLISVATDGCLDQLFTFKTLVYPVTILTLEWITRLAGVKPSHSVPAMTSGTIPIKRRLAHQ